MAGDLDKKNLMAQTSIAFCQVICTKKNDNFHGSNLTVPNLNKVSKRSTNLTADGTISYFTPYCQSRNNHRSTNNDKKPNQNLSV